MRKDYYVKEMQMNMNRGSGSCWLDRKSILPWMNWETLILSAFAASAFIASFNWKQIFSSFF